MEILNFPGADQPAPKKKKPARAILGIGIIAAVAALSSTLAANININSGPVEFGQGVAQTVSCGDSEVPIIVTPSTTFQNSGTSVSATPTNGADSWYNRVEIDTTGLAVGMVVTGTNIEPNTVIMTLGDGWLYLNNYTTWNDDGPITFSASAGTPTSMTPNDWDTSTSNWLNFTDTSDLVVGMVVSGDGIPSNTVIVTINGNEIDTNNSFVYSSGAISFTNSGGGTFAMSSITLSDIPDACNGKVFTIKVYDNNSSTPLTLGNLDGTDTSALVWWANGWSDGSNNATRENEAAVYFPGSDWLCFNWESDCYNNTYAVETAYYGNSDVASHSFKLNLPTPIDATRVYKITLETQDDSSALNIWGDNWGFYQEWL